MLYTVMAKNVTERGGTNALGWRGAPQTLHSRTEITRLSSARRFKHCKLQSVLVCD